MLLDLGKEGSYTDQEIVYWAQKHGYYLVTFLDDAHYGPNVEKFPHFKLMVDTYRGIALGVKDGEGHAFAKVNHLLYNPTDGVFHPLSKYDEFTDRAFLAWVNKPPEISLTPWYKVFDTEPSTP